MESGTLSAADVALLNRDDGFGGSGWGGMIWLFAILALFGGGGFGFGGNGNGNAIQADVQRGFDAQNTINAIKDGNASLIREFGNVETALTAMGGLQRECCCNILRAVDGVNYNGAINTASINANTTAQIQKVMDAIMGNRMADMQNQINQLQLQSAMAGVLRYPTSWTYNAGVFPPVSGTAAPAA